MYIHLQTAASVLKGHPQNRSPVRLHRDFSAPEKSDEFKQKLRFSHLVVKERKWILVQPIVTLPEHWFICKCDPQNILFMTRQVTMRVSCPRRR